MKETEKKTDNNKEGEVTGKHKTENNNESGVKGKHAIEKKTNNNERGDDTVIADNDDENVHSVDTLMKLVG